MPCDYKNYPKNWKAIRQEILKRAKDRCEFCNAPNHAYGYREYGGSKEGTFQLVSYDHEEALDTIDVHSWDAKLIRIVLTIAHMNHKTMDSRRSNLKALCQRCHNNYDADHRRKNRSHTLELKKTHPKQVVFF